MAAPSSPSSPTSHSTPEKRATIRRFLYRQLFVTPTLPSNVELKGKTAIVTGANTGIGLECARQLLDFGLSKLIVAVRDESRGQAASTNLSAGRNLPDGIIEVWKLDLASNNSITAFVDRAKTLERLDIVVLNAGIMKQAHELVPATGHEQTIQVNYLATALLTVLLLPVFKVKNITGQPGRLVWVSSDMASWTKLKEKDSKPLLPAFDKPESFGVFDRYCASKLLGQLFLAELTKRVPPSVAIITIPNPGLCYGTGLGRAPGGSIADSIASFLKRLVGRSSSVGARVLTDGVVNHGLEAHGQYIEDCEIQP
jgi:NAD(P)-dependent dehydrogenase (short-subunit alcohol dehydrogenase family)